MKSLSLFLKELIDRENPKRASARKDLVKENGHSLTWQRYHRLAGAAASFESPFFIAGSTISADDC